MEEGEKLFDDLRWWKEVVLMWKIDSIFFRPLSTSLARTNFLQFAQIYFSLLYFASIFSEGTSIRFDAL